MITTKRLTTRPHECCPYRLVSGLFRLYFGTFINSNLWAVLQLMLKISFDDESRVHRLQCKNTFSNPPPQHMKRVHFKVPISSLNVYYQDCDEVENVHTKLLVHYQYTPTFTDIEQIRRRHRNTVS